MTQDTTFVMEYIDKWIEINDRRKKYSERARKWREKNPEKVVEINRRTREERQRRKDEIFEGWMISEDIVEG